MNKFLITLLDGDLYYEGLFWISKKGYCFRKVRINGEEGKTKRISEADYISAYETYKNY